MIVANQVPIAPATVVSDLALGDLRAALGKGWADFKAFPAFGLFFAAFYVAAGLMLYFLLVGQGEYLWIISLTAGFPLFAPFTAVGLYEVSRRREAGLPITWRAVLGAMRGHGDEQIISMGMVLFVAFGFWLGIAHGVYAIFMSGSQIDPHSIAAFTTGAGLAMMLVGGSVGALMALGFYAITVVSLPMLVDREVDFITAIIVSLAVIRSNTAVLLAWAVLIAVALFAAMLPLFLGLLMVLPVLGHATWHLYRRAVT